MPHVLIAADKFKGSLTAAQVGAALSAGMLSLRGDLTVAVAPVADGGDGTLAAALAAGYHRVPVTVTGPTGQPVPTAVAIRDDSAVVELADACGLLRLPGGVLAPLTASSRGLGEAIRAALDAGARRIVVGIGGSASTDGGAGLVAALGARLLGPAGVEIADGGEALAEVVTLDPSGLHPALSAADIEIACDVDNPLTGPIGAAAVYGPQKGATALDVARLDAALGHWADLVATTTGRDLRDAPGAGAAGGVGFAATALLGATLRPGTDLLFDLVGFPDALSRADLVVTGEGSLDEQTLHGKAPAGVLRAAGQVPVVAVCGRCQLPETEWRAAGFAAVYPLTDLEPDPAASMRTAPDLLYRIGSHLAQELDELLGLNQKGNS